MALFRRLCSLLVILAFVLGTMIPASNPSTAHVAGASASEHSMPADCDQGDSAAAPMPCGKAFCFGMAIIQVPVGGSPNPAFAKFGPAPDQNGVGVTRFPDPDPPRTISIG
jgi:hypothetical protein